MKSRWIIAAAAVAALAILTIPILRGGNESVADSVTGGRRASGGAGQSVTCDATGRAKLDFVLKDMNNQPLNVAAYKGKVVLLNFWATWCGPCKEEIPSFVELYDKYKDQGLVILGVSIDDTPEQLRSFTKEWHMQYPIAQMQTDIEDAYGPFYGVPTSFIIARDGSICTKHLGPASKDEFEHEIKGLLESKPAL
jgi:thiol-disulfide isomerase/thioredoxin